MEVFTSTIFTINRLKILTILDGWTVIWWAVLDERVINQQENQTACLLFSFSIFIFQQISSWLNLLRSYWLGAPDSFSLYICWYCCFVSNRTGNGPGQGLPFFFFHFFYYISLSFLSFLWRNPTYLCWWKPDNVDCKMLVL